MLVITRRGGRRRTALAELSLAIVALAMAAAPTGSALTFRQLAPTTVSIDRWRLTAALDSTTMRTDRSSIVSSKHDQRKLESIVTDGDGEGDESSSSPTESISVRHSEEEIAAANKAMFSRIDPARFDPSFTHAACWYEDGRDPNFNYSNLAQSSNMSDAMMANGNENEGAASIPRFMLSRLPKDNQVLRCIPKLYILGVAKSATSDCWSRITRHSLFARCRSNSGTCHHLKEPHFWTIGDRAEYWNTTSLGRKRRENVSTKDHSKIQHIESINGYIDFYQRYVLDILLHPRKAIIDASSDIFSESISGMPGPSRPHITGPFKDQPLSKYITTPETMKALVPDAKLVVLLREPAERLFSDYMYFNRTTRQTAKTPETFHSECMTAIHSLQTCLKEATKQFGYEPMPASVGHDVQQITLASMSRQRTNSENKDTDEFAQRLPSHRAFLSCVDTGGWRDTAIAPDPMELQTCPLHLSVYYYGVKFWQEVFQSQLMVIRKEDYHQDKDGVLREIFTHFSMRQPTAKDWSKIRMACQSSESCNVGEYHHSSSSSTESSSSLKAPSDVVRPETLAELRKFYQPFNAYLAAVVGDVMFNWN